ncbi:hypothetical protein RZE82_08700 [Mollicutes bacterium LVI A0039]|nr:hypothetical protein RZE82_08700 [Mollicutes bacterium LVI A0039]
MTKKSIFFIFTSNLCLFLILFNCLTYEGNSTINNLRMNGSVGIESTGTVYENKQEFNEDVEYLNEHGYSYIFYKVANNENVVEMTCSNYQLVVDYDCSSGERMEIDGITYSPLQDSTMETFLVVEGVDFPDIAKELGINRIVSTSAYPYAFNLTMIISFILLMLIVTLLYSSLSLQFIKRQLNVLILIGFSNIKTLSYFTLRYSLIQAIVSVITFLLSYNYFRQYEVYKSLIEVANPTVMLIICNVIIFVYNTVILLIIINSQANEFQTLEEIGL